MQKNRYKTKHKATRSSAKQRRNKKMLEDVSLLNVWRGNGFAMCGLGEKLKSLAKIKHAMRCLKWSKQRATRGFADCDVWNMYGYLEELMPAMLQYLKDNRMGSPAMLGENYTDKTDSCRTTPATKNGTKSLTG